MMSGLSDKAIAVFAFAAYHQLESGQPVTKVIRDDEKGHKADDEAVRELEGLGLAKAEGNDITFSQNGLATLAKAVESLRSVAQ
jgi:chromosome segregation and condensation protein ScpB